MWTREFWKATAERVIRAFALAFLATIGGGTVADVRAIDWRAALLVAALTAGLNLLVSLAAGAGIGPKGSPSLVRDPAAAGPVGDPIDTLADHDRRVQREDLVERLHGSRRTMGGYSAGDKTSAELDPPPQSWLQPHQPGEHRRDPDLPSS